MEINEIYKWLNNTDPALNPEFKMQWEALSNAIWFDINTKPWQFDSEKFEVLLSLAKVYNIELPNKKTLHLLELYKMIFKEDNSVNDMNALITKFTE